MHGPSLAILLVVATLQLAPSSSIAGTPEVVAQARRKLAVDDGIAAVDLLEAALPDAGANKETVLALLQKAYESAARQAIKAGRSREAETYRENLKILNRKARPARNVSAVSERPTVEPIPIPTPAVENRNEGPPPLLDPLAGPTLLPEGPSPAPGNPEPSTPVVAEVLPLTDEPPPVVLTKESPSSEPSPVAPVPVQPPTSDLATADAAFSGKDYREAGRIYNELARVRQLPTERRGPWLYCRAFEVVNRINAHPSTKLEWASINAEIDQIRSIEANLNAEIEQTRSPAPKFYLGEYLRNLAAERQVDRKKTKPSTTMVVRGSAPEEPPAPNGPVRPASNLAAPEPTRISPTLASNNSAAAARIGTSAGRWQVLDSTNFRIYHVDPTLAARVAKAAESARLEQMKRWSSPTPPGNWTPPCEIYLYPSAKQYAQMTGQPEDSPGFSTMGMNGGRIISRRVNLRADHPTVVDAVLPHEITHVILADFFTERQIPRWADEGLAVLAEPVDEQLRRAADLVNPLTANRMFMVDVLMNMDYPDSRYWALYYAQSVSLTRYLVEQGTPAQMIQFLQGAQTEGYEASLRRVYQIDGFPDLQKRWLTYARAKVQAPATASAPATGPDLRIR